MDQYLIGALAAWMVYWAAVAVVQVGGLGMTGRVMEAALGWGWLAAPAVLVAGVVGWLRSRRREDYQPGDHVIYKMPKRSSHPSPRAEQLHASPHGEQYAYVISKGWTVVEVRDDNRIDVVTPGGKHRVLDIDDPLLHKAGLRDELKLRLVLHKQFPPMQQSA